MSIIQDVAVEATKSAPPVAVTGAIVMGMTPSDWVTILTLAYLVLQIYFSILKNRREAKESKDKEKKSGNAE